MAVSSLGPMQTQQPGSYVAATCSSAARSSGWRRSSRRQLLVRLMMFLVSPVLLQQAEHATYKKSFIIQIVKFYKYICYNTQEGKVDNDNTH